MSDEHQRAAETHSVPQPAESAGSTPNRGSVHRSKSPLITAIEIENFKGIGRPVRIDLRPITLLFGSNSAGKSSVLHALCYAHEVLTDGNVDARETRLGGDQIDLGGFHRFAHAYSRTREVRLCFALNLRGRSIPYLADLDEGVPLRSANREALSGLRAGWLALSIAWSEERNAPILRHCEVGVDGQVVGRVSQRSRATGDLRVNSQHPFANYAKVLLAGCRRLVLDELSQLRYVGPLRRLHPHAGTGRRGAALGHWADGSAAWDLLNDHARRGSGDEVVRTVSDWLSREDRLATGYALRLDPIPDSVDLPKDGLVQWLAYKHGVLMSPELSRQRAAGTPTPDSAGSPGDIVPNAVAYEVSFGSGRLVGLARHERTPRVALVNTWVRLPVRTSDVGTGISQILPVVVAALDPDRPGITAIEQPELHVHPRLQVELGDLFAQGADQGGVFLIETHSEHLMLRLLRRIEQTSSNELPEGKPGLKPDHVSVVYVEQVEGRVKATRLRIDETGEFIDRWPQGFFDERDNELF